jgi:hypothetical protein
MKRDLAHRGGGSQRPGRKLFRAAFSSGVALTGSWEDRAGRRIIAYYPYARSEGSPPRRPAGRHPTARPSMAFVAGTPTLFG